MTHLTFARASRLAVVIVGGAAIATGCDLDTTMPIDSTEFCAEQSCGPKPGTIAAAIIPTTTIGIAPNATSTTGIPILVLPSGVGFPFTMNNHHQVVGTGRSPVHGFNTAMLWNGDDGYTDVIPGRPYIHSSGIRVEDINDAGALIGTIGLGSGAWVLSGGALYNPSPQNGGGEIRGRRIAEDGTALISFDRSSPSGLAGAILRFPYTSNDYVAIPLADPSSSSSQNAYGLDLEADLVVGSSKGGPFKWRPGESSLTFMPGNVADATNGTDIAGRATFGGVIHAALLGVGDPIDLGSLGGFSTSSDINSSGWVAGYGAHASGSLRALAWRGPDEMIDLGTIDGHPESRAFFIDDHGHVLGFSGSITNPTLVIWFLDAAAPNTAPDIQTIISQTVTIGEQLVVTPVVTDLESDPFTLTWTGDIPANAVINGIFDWTPEAGQEGDYTITVTATQDDDATLSDSETFVVSVLPAAVASTDLEVSLAPATVDQKLLGSGVSYLASIHNAGLEAVAAQLTIALEYRDQADWGTVPSEAVINGIFVLDTELIAPGGSTEVPFEVLYNAFGVHEVTATVGGEYNELDPADNVAGYAQVVDLPLDAPGVLAGGLDLPGSATTDGEGLAIVGLRVPSILIAGDPGVDLFVPSDLTPKILLTGDGFVSGGTFLAGNLFNPSDGYVPGDMYGTIGSSMTGEYFVTPQATWLAGRVVVPGTNSWDPAGRLIFVRGNSDLKLGGRGGTELAVEKGAGPGLKVTGAGGASKSQLAFCKAGFDARLGGGDAAEFACGSLTTTVLTGEVSVLLADGTRIDIAAGAEVEITEDGSGGWTIDQLAGTADDVTITPPATNGAPVAVPGGPYVSVVGQSFTLDGSGSTDPDNDPLTYAWHLDDGSATGITALGVTPTMIAPSSPDLYLLTLTVTDPTGASSSSIIEVAVYDPTASSITGGGWFDSPPGALRDNPGAVGKATFAFHVGYKRGRSIPDGNARVAFEAGGLKLTSDSFDWLVVGGDMARFRGVGTLEARATPVRFEITAREPNTIRVRIWDDEVGVIYETLDLVIGGGRIVIRK